MTASGSLPTKKDRQSRCSVEMIKTAPEVFQVSLPPFVPCPRGFLIELLTITIGILIALSLESLLEWHHHRELKRNRTCNLSFATTRTN